LAKEKLQMANWYPTVEVLISLIGVKPEDRGLEQRAARIYGTRTPLPDRQDSREYLAHLHELENEAKAAKRGRAHFISKEGWENPPTAHWRGIAASR
jgi:hypothetical protein